MSAAAFGIACFLPMIIEAFVSARHERVLGAAGAIEPAGDVYRWMQVAYPGAFAAMLGEGALRASPIDTAFAVGCVVFAVAKALKYWAIAALGERWTFRVLVPPLAARIQTGPYRWLRHPNYIAVAGELVGAAVAMRAIVTAVPAIGGFVYLMWRRIQVEEKALGLQ